MKGIVWGLTFERANKKLLDIKAKYEFMHIPIEIERQGNHIHSIVYTNGDTWKAVSVKDSARGNRANVAYIERGIAKDPKLLAIAQRCLIEFPWSAYRYYGD